MLFLLSKIDVCATFRESVYSESLITVAFYGLYEYFGHIYRIVSVSCQRMDLCILDELTLFGLLILQLSSTHLSQLIPNASPEAINLISVSIPALCSTSVIPEYNLTYNLDLGAGPRGLVSTTFHTRN